MSLRRVAVVARRELTALLRRPLFVTWVLFLTWNAWLMSRGSWFYRSVDTSVGTTVSWVNSEFQVAFVMALMTFLLLAFYVALATGTGVARDREQRVDALLHATPLRAGEYVWGTFAGAFAGVLAAIGALVVALVVCNHVLPDPSTPESYGPLALRNYLMPALAFLIPASVLTGGLAFAIGSLTRRTILVFLLPISAMLFYNQFFWGWVPPEMTSGWVRFFQAIDPSGFRWLKQTWLVTDRGIAYYNSHPIVYDAAFVASRIGHVVVGLALVAWTARRLGRTLRRSETSWIERLRRSRSRSRTDEPVSIATPRFQPPLAALAMDNRSPSTWRAIGTVARSELRELLVQPGLYIFVPIVFLTSIVLLGTGGGPYGTTSLVTSGTAAAVGLQTATFWSCLLLLFYGVEALRREHATGFADIFRATPVPTVATLAGKALATSTIALAVLFATFTASWVKITQSGTGLELGPFALLWGLLFVPTVALWLAFVTAIYALTGNRWTTYGVAVAAIAGTAWLAIQGTMTWVTNWPLLLAVVWSDMGSLEIDAWALLLNRSLALAGAALLAVIAVLVHARRDRDPAAATAKQRGQAVPRSWRYSVAALVVLVAGLTWTLWREVHSSFDGDHARRRAETYWRTNVATWLDAEVPDLQHVELEMELEPTRRQATVEGWYDVVNPHAEPLAWIPISTGLFWDDLAFTLNGTPHEPTPHDGLWVFAPPGGLAPGATARIGFSYRATMPKGSSRNGGPLAFGEFILPAGIVATSRNAELFPVVGYVATKGIDDDNRYEPARHPYDFHRGITTGGTDRAPFTHKLTITAPADYTINATGSLTGETNRADGRTTAVWETTYPLRVFNLIGGRYDVVRGDRTAVFHHPPHTRNLDVLLEALDASLTYYGRWFHPYVWDELRLSEFPAVSFYARGNPTNIFFSEGIGFLTSDGGTIDMPFMIAAHEAAHQWWGHILSPGDGPGGIVLAEGAAHFATMMLLEQVRGPQQRMAFARGIERTYGEIRQPTSEKPLIGSYLHRPGDFTVVYGKGSWVLWMLMRQMGRDAFLTGTQDFFRQYHHNPDHPVLQDFVAVMRPHAPDPAAFDAFVAQWLYEKVMPEYRLLEVEKAARDDGRFDVVVRLANVGTGRMPVDVAAQAGRRFDADGQPHESYRECRGNAVLGSGEETTLRLDCDFEPERLVVDPDVDVFQLQRQAARTRL